MVVVSNQSDVCTWQASGIEPTLGLLHRLFQTLDPTLRQAELPSGRHVILSDTVGFIDNLPPSLIKAFQVTPSA